MITKILVTAFLASLNALLTLLPSWTLPDMDDGGQIVGTYVYFINFIFPVVTILTVITASFALRGIMSGWDLIVWVYHQFWGGD